METLPPHQTVTRRDRGTGPRVVGDVGTGIGLIDVAASGNNSHHMSRPISSMKNIFSGVKRERWLCCSPNPDARFPPYIRIILGPVLGFTVPELLRT